MTNPALSDARNNLVLKRYGNMAPEESASRADELAADGDNARMAVWRRIIDVIAELANATSPGPMH